MDHRAPVNDWLTDWDHLDPQWVEDPFPIWNEIRSAGCPIAHTDRYRGVYLPTRYADIREIAYDPEHFSSRQVVVRDTQPITGGGAPPITSDPPKHRAARMVLLPPVHAAGDRQAAPQGARDLQRADRCVCRQAGLRCARSTTPSTSPCASSPPCSASPRATATGSAPGSTRSSKPAPPTTAVLQRALDEITEYFHGHMEARRADPGDDLISYLMNAKYPDGQPFKDNHVLGSLRLLLVAGIDTTWSGIGASHLAPGADAGRPRAAGRASRRSSRRRSRNSCAPSRPSPWRALVAKEATINGCTFQRGRDGDAVLPRRQPRPGRCSPTPTRSSSTARRTGTRRSASASTAVSAPTSRAWR